MIIVNSKCTDGFLQIEQSSKTFNRLSAKIAVTLLKKQISLNITNKELAKHLGVTCRRLSKWKDGEYNFCLSDISRICKYLNVDCCFSCINIGGLNGNS